MFGKQKSDHHKKIASMICPLIPDIVDNSKQLAFVVWCSNEHMSLVLKCEKSFYFLDSCGYYFQRFPIEESGILIPGKNAIK